MTSSSSLAVSQYDGSAAVPTIVKSRKVFLLSTEHFIIKGALRGVV